MRRGQAWRGSRTHLETTAVALSRERVRRAKLGVELIRRYAPELVASKRGAAGLGIPAVAAAAAR